MIKLEKITKFYKTEGSVAIGLLDINLEFNVGEFVAIIGSSGAGKTTLLNIISGMDTYDEGDMYINGVSTVTYSLEELENYRRSNVAFIFQNYQLIDSYTVLENVMVELLFKGYSKKEAKAKAVEYLKIVGMGHRLKNRATKLSGGEKQRVVIARALASDANILVCDEPTGNLDSKNSLEIMKILKNVSKNKLVFLVTHDESLIEGNATRVIKVKDGKIDEDRTIEPVNKEELVLVNSNKNSIGTNFYVALKNLLRTPKKSLFVLLVFLALSFLLVISISYLPLQILATSTSKTSYMMYTNDDPNRIVCYYDEALDYSNIDAIKIKKDYYLDNSYKITVNDPKISKYLMGYSYSLISDESFDLVSGKMPEEENEILLIVDSSFSDEYLKSTLNSNCVILAPYFDNNRLKYANVDCAFKIVGYGHSKTKFSNFNFYLSEKGINKFIKERANIGDCHSVLGDLSLTIEGSKYNIEITNYYYLYDIILSQEFRDIPLDDVAFLLGIKKIDLSNYNVGYGYFGNGTKCLITEEFYNYLVINIDYRMSFYTNEDNIDNVYNQLSAMSNHLAFKLRDATKEENNYDITSILKNVFYFLFLGLEILISLFIASLVTSFVLGTKKKELGVLRVIGLSQKDVLVVLCFELITIMLLSFVSVMGISAIFSFDIASFNLSFVFSSPARLIASFIILILMSLFIAFRWNKKMFKKTAREVLKVGDSI